MMPAAFMLLAAAMFSCTLQLAQAHQAAIANSGRRLAAAKPAVLLGGSSPNWRAAAVYRAGSRVKVTGAVRTTAAGSATAAASAAYFQPSGRSLLALKGAAGQLRVDVTLRSGGGARRGHVSALSMLLGASVPARGRRLSAACTKLPVQVTAYRDFKSCAEYAAAVRALGGSVKQAAGCSGNFRRVKLATTTYNVPLGRTLSLKQGGFSSLDFAVLRPACGQLVLRALSASFAPGPPPASRAQLGVQQTPAPRRVTPAARAPIATQPKPKPAPTPAPTKVAAKPAPAPTPAPTKAAAKLPAPSPPPPPAQEQPRVAAVSSPPPPVEALPPSYCRSASGLVLYTRTAAPATTYSAGGATSAVGICSAVGRKPAAATAAALQAAAAACKTPSGTYVYTAPAQAVKETDFCPFAQLTKSAAGAYTAAMFPSEFACGSSGFGALVACA